MAREPAAIRYKNPGAMWPNAIATKWGSTRWVYLNDGTGQGGNGKGNKIAIFDNWVDGIAAQLDLWRTRPTYKNQPFSKAIAIWSGGNHVEEYIAHVLRRIPGMTRNTVMNDAFWNSPNGIRFLRVQATHEAGKPIPATDAEYEEAQRRVFGKQPPLVKTKPSDAVIPTVTIGTAETAAHTSGLSIGWMVAIGVALVAGFVIWNVFKQYRALKALEEEIANLEVTPPQAPPPAPAPSVEAPTAIPEKTDAPV